MTRAWNGLARRLAPALLGALLWPAGLAAQAAGEPEGNGGLPTVAEKTAGLERRDGLLPLWIDRLAGRVWLEVPAPGAAPAADLGPGVVGRYLYVEGLLTGLGSNPVGLDRGQLGETRVVALRWVGNRLLVEAENLGYRALSEDPLEVRAVEESFADSVLWAGELAAVEGAPPARALVDFTSFIVRDAHDVAGTLRRSEEGSYSLDRERSAIDLDACLAFPDNLELEALLTFATAGDPGREVAEAAAVPDAFSIVQHHSLLRLPEPGYEPRAFDPRSGSYAIGFADYAAPLDAPLRRRWIVR
ncbi:MAG TPA: DUF5117 domain-containing protein, partial [Thermoanaerobaculia bacterium]|nr:DUF5117 domain-containing protein [Thermoanaerobaculia bacterium]